MKKLLIIALVFVLAVSLVACGRSKNDETTPSTTQPSTGMDVIPDMNPMETNIPDPNVDSTMPMYTDGTNGADMTIPSDAMTSNNNK